MLSVNRKCEQSVTTDERRTKVLVADKEKVHGDRTLGNIGGNNNKDAKAKAIERAKKRKKFLFV